MQMIGEAEQLFSQRRDCLRQQRDALLRELVAPGHGPRTTADLKRVAALDQGWRLMDTMHAAVFQQHQQFQNLKVLANGFQLLSSITNQMTTVSQSLVSTSVSRVVDDLNRVGAQQQSLQQRMDELNNAALTNEDSARIDQLLAGAQLAAVALPAAPTTSLSVASSSSSITSAPSASASTKLSLLDQ